MPLSGREWDAERERPARGRREACPPDGQAGSNLQKTGRKPADWTSAALGIARGGACDPRPYGLSRPAFADDCAGVTEKSIAFATTNPLTGAAAAPCKPVSDGALAWFAKVNKDGGVHGRMIEDQVLDDQYQAQQALANARTFVRNQVFAVFGGCGAVQEAGGDVSTARPVGRSLPLPLCQP